MTKLDGRGRPFTVEYTKCIPCESGYYQSSQGNEFCIACPGKVGKYNEAISDEACVYSKSSDVKIPFL